jgi:hypothetical protein
MKTRDKNPNVRVDDEPEDERPMGTGDDEAPPPNGLAADPYADDLLIGSRRTRVSRWRVIGIVVLMVVVALIVLVVLRLRGV